MMPNDRVLNSTNWLDADSLAEAISSESGLLFKAGAESVKGQPAPVVRPESPPYPSGFRIALFRLPGTVIAQLVLDNFARDLQSSMVTGLRGAEAGQIWSSAQSHRLLPTILIDDRSFTSLEDLPDEDLGILSLRVEVPQVSTVTAAIFDSSVEATLFLVGLVLSSVPTTGDEATALVDVEHDVGLPEGAVTRVEVNRYERSRKNRLLCLAVHGYCCSACGMRFEDVYGGIGRDFIEVHHLVPVSQMGEHYAINPIEDLAPLCSNCHRMVHRSDPPYSVEDIARVVRTARREE